MDLSSLPCLGPSGMTLTVEERSALQVSMLAIQRKENLSEKLKFWGKVAGETNDYLVAYKLVPSFGFPVKAFYYCTTAQNASLVQMPVLSDDWKAMASAIKMPFRGEPSLPLKGNGAVDEEAAEADAAEAEAEPEDGEEPPPPREQFREEHRLAWTVAEIDHDVAVLPRGAFIVDAAHQVRRNKAFEGLSYAAAGNMGNYFHFRFPESARARACIEKPGIVRAADFLDPIVEDLPNGVWSLTYDNSSTMSLLRSFYWPGFFFFHSLESSEYGSVYFGTGLPNEDIAFML